MVQKMFVILSLLSIFLSTTTTHAHNITLILRDHPEFSTFNHYLTATHLAPEINLRRTITVCVVDNTAMNDLLSKHYSLPTIKNILSLHILADYFGDKKLHHIPNGSTTASTLFQATGEATGTSGYLNITNTDTNTDSVQVGFTPVDSDITHQPMATFVKSIKESPYNISVIQISNILTSPEAEAPTASPTEVNLTSLMALQGCKAFSDLVKSQAGVEDTFVQSISGGLTIFCPSNGAVKSIMPEYENLTAAGKTSLLLYHGVPEYYSLEMLRSNKEFMKTLATGGGNGFNLTVQDDGEDVKVDTGVSTATIDGTLIDEDPLAVYKIDVVLLPRELFKAAPSRADAPADAPGPAGDDEVPADVDGNGGGRIVGGGGVVALCFSLVLGFLARDF